MSRVERKEYEYQRPDGTVFKEVEVRVIREAPEYASSPEYNEREARRLRERRHMWAWANAIGRSRKERRRIFRQLRSGYEGP